MPDDKLKDASTHFAFGENWAAYAKLINEPEIEEAKRGLHKLVPAADLVGRSFIDIGCGSGLHALAAARSGVGRIVAVDVDRNSVETTKAVLEKHGVTVPWTAHLKSVFDLDPATDGQFDIVYSWGVLHHTGAMYEAIEKAAALTRPGGLFAFALYRRTRMDAFWLAEKKWYAHAPAALQKAARGVYIAAFASGFTLKGGNFRRHVATYRSSRGMDWYHDVHDWLGGYPYETMLAPDVEALMQRLGFKPERVFARPLTVGVLGSGCDEYVYRRTAP